MRRYEQIYILHPSLNEEEINSVIENTNQIICDEAGTIISNVKWGMKKLAYPIKKELQGYYVFCDFATTPAAVAEVERKFRIDESVLKYLSVKLADSISAEEISIAQEEAAAKAVILEEENEESDVKAGSAVTETKEKSEVTETKEKSEVTETKEKSEVTETEEKSEVTETEEKSEVTETEEKSEVIETEEKSEVIETEEKPEVTETEENSDVTETKESSESEETSKA